MRFVFALPGAVLGVLLIVAGPVWSRLSGAVILLDLGFQLLPWQLPRRDRGAVGYWLESVLSLLPMTLVALVGLAVAAPWAVATPNPLWFLVSLPLAAGLLLLSRLDLRGVASGDLAFLLGPSRRSHSAARATANAVAPLGEEYVFRGAAIRLPDVSPALALLSAAAFVSRHHVPPGMRRSERRVILVELTAATGFTLLAVASGSVYPSLLAHLLNNAPHVIIQVQQLRAREV
jgi:membrane protease YdiL (CAAX protease family)